MTKFYTFSAAFLLSSFSLLSAQEAAPEPETSVNLGFNLTRGNQDTVLVEVGGESIRPYGDHTLTLTAAYAYGETQTDEEDITTRDTSNAKVRYDYVFSDPWFGYAEAEALRDELASIDYRITAGPGFGKHLMKTETFELTLDAGVAWVAEKVGEDSNGDVAARAGQKLRWDLSENAKLTQSVSYLRKFNDDGDELIEARITAESILTGNLSLRLDLKNRYESNPAEDKDSNNLTFTTGIAVKL
jgi:putative salt-induced outer membrane protein YdiY